MVLLFDYITTPALLSASQKTPWKKLFFIFGSDFIIAIRIMVAERTVKKLSNIVRVIDKVFETGRKYATEFKNNMLIQFDELLPKWNDTAIPQSH